MTPSITAWPPMLERFSDMVWADYRRGNVFVKTGLIGVFVLVLVSETLHTAGGVYELLLPGEEGMATGTDLDVDVLHGGARLDDVPAVARDFRLFIFGMGFFLHYVLLRSFSTAALPPGPAVFTTLWTARRSVRGLVGVV